MTTLLALLIIFFWGVWGLFSKIASAKLGGEKAFFYDVFTYFILTILIVAIFFRKNLFSVDRSGLIAAFLAGNKPKIKPKITAKLKEVISADNGKDNSQVKPLDEAKIKIK